MGDKLNKLASFNLPSLEKLPEIHDSLKLINTIYVIPQHSSFENG